MTANLAKQGTPGIDESIIEGMRTKTGATLSANTKRVLSSTLRDFNRFLEQTGGKVDAEAVLAYLGALEGRVRGKTLNVRKSTLKRLLLAHPAFQADLELQAKLDSLFRQVRSVRVDNRVLEDRYCTLEEIDRMLAYCREGNQRRRRAGLIIEALFQTAARVSEFTAIRLEDCTLNGHVSIRIRSGKGSKERTVHMTRDLFDRIRSEFKSSTFLFEAEQRMQQDGTIRKGGPLTRESISRTLKSVAKAVRIEKELHPHLLRHSYAMHMIHARHKPVKAVSMYLGHAAVATTLNHYCHGSFESAGDALDF